MARAKKTTVDLTTMTGRHTPSGHFIAWPDEHTGTMCAYTKKGVLVETREIGEDGTEERMNWEDWADEFGEGLNAEEYECDECDEDDDED